MVGVNVDDPVPINVTFVVTLRTVERCLVRRPTLRVGISGNHFLFLSPNGDKGAVLGFVRNRLRTAYNEDFGDLLAHRVVEDMRPVFSTTSLIPSFVDTVWIMT